jgi:Ca-activated chloride channel family protein
MEALADKGNGNYAYIDDIAEAKKVFGAEMGGTLLTLAKDVKLQVEFNPEKVASYRLIGYENRMLRKEDFDDDTKDAGEIGAGHSVTALYEIVPKGSQSVASATEPLRYQTVAATRRDHGNELMYVKLRYKQPDASTSRLLDHVVSASRPGTGSTDLRFAGSVAAFGMILRDSEYRGSATLDDVLTLARGALGEDEGGYRAEFVKLVEQVKAQSLLATKER